MTFRFSYKLIAAAVAILIACSALAQNSASKQWSDGPLNWADFQAVAPSGERSNLKTDIFIVTKNIPGTDGTTRMELSTQALMYPSQSAASAASQTTLRLRYHQLQFDLLEYYRRCLQNDLNSGTNGKAAEERLAYYRNQFAERIRHIDSETAYGSNEEKIRQWEDNVQQQLVELGSPANPELVPSKWCYGIYAGLGAAFPTGSIANNFKGAAIFHAGLTAGYRRFRLKADVSYGQPKFKNYNIFGQYDEQGHDTQKSATDHATQLLVRTTLGFSVVDSKYFAITPFAGGMWSTYRWSAINYEWKWDETEKEFIPKQIGDPVKASISNFNWVAGIDFDFKVHRHVTNVPFLVPDGREEFTSIVRLTPFIGQAVFNNSVPSTKGFFVGFTVTYTGLARALMFK